MLSSCAAFGRTSSVAKYHSAVLPGAWKICEGILGCAQLSTKPRKDDQDPWVEDIASKIRQLPEFGKLRPTLEVYSDEQLKEIEKADFLQSFDLKFKGLAALFWNKVHAESSKVFNLVQEDGRPETFKLTSSEELKEILEGNGASGIKPIDDPHSRVLRNLKDVEPGKTYMLVWGIMTQAKSLGIGFVEPEQ